MLNDITTGSSISVKIVKEPTSAAARKTLVRVLSKDEQIQTENKRLRRIRKKHFRFTPRGGRGYPIYVIKQRPVKGRKGEHGTVLATTDVVHDLHSVSRFIEVTGNKSHSHK